MNRRPQPHQRCRRVMAALAALVAAASLSACTEVEKAEQEHYSPSTIAPLKGQEDVVAVTLTQEGADRIEIATDEVRKRGRRKLIPYAALLYENDGSAFVYTNPRGLTYLRAHVEIHRVAGDRVLLDEGPAVGSSVVTIGAAQLHGAELEYGEY